MRLFKNALAALLAFALALGPAAPAFAADNIVVLDGAGASKTMKTKDNAGVHTPATSLTKADGSTLIDPASDANQVLEIAQQTALNTIAGLQADSACATDNGACTISALLKRANQRTTSLITLLGAAPMQSTGGTVGLVAGSALIGKFGIDQTTPGTTNAVQLAATDPLLAAVTGVGTTVTYTFARPNNATPYTVNDAITDSTSAPTAFPIANACRTSGGSGVLLDVVAISNIDAAVPPQMELWIFDSSFTSTNDNAAFTLSDTDSLKLVAVIPLTFSSTQNSSGQNAFAQALSNQAFTCNGSANLYFEPKAKNAYIPTGLEQFTVRFKFNRTS